MTCVTNKPHRHKAGITAADAAFPVTYRFAPVAINHVWTPQHAKDEGMRGTTFEASEGVVYDKGSGSGPITIEPRPDDLRKILPLLLMGTFSTNDIEPAGACNYFGFQHDAWAQEHRFGGCVTNTWSLASSSRAPVVKLEWGFESKTFTAVAAGSFPSLNLSVLQPFVHSATTLTIDGTAYKIDDVTLAGNNNLDLDIFYNSPTRTDLPLGMQQFTLTHSSPFDDADGIALLNNGASAVAATLVYTSGNYSLTVTMPGLQSPVPTPVMAAGNAPVRLNGIQWTARTVAGDAITSPIKFTLDDSAL